jgi:hypothetical protein
MDHPTKTTKHDESIADILIFSLVVLMILTFVILVGIF